MIMTTLKWETFEPKFGSWARYIKPFFDEGGFDPIYTKLKEESKDKRIITPKSENTFKFLEKVDPDNLKAILIGMDAYPKRYFNGEFQATGIAFDCSNSPDGKIQPSLNTFYDGLVKDLGITEIDKTPDLNYLCEQGVLLGNRALTCRLEQTGSHMGLWDPFWKFFLEDVIMAYFTGVPIVLMGKDAHALKRHIFPIGNPLFMINHPSFAARSGEDWNTEGTFTAINKILKENNGLHICWNNKDWELPF